MPLPHYMGNILVVDDTPHNVQLLTRILNGEGYTIRTALSGAEALDAVDEFLPDVILLDVQMPDMDGYEVCEQLKADEALAHIPIIFISALADTEGIVRALNAGGVDYVTKPFNIQEVLARVNSQMVAVEQRYEIERLREQDLQHYHAIDEMKNEFIRMATHDLKNPLGIIMGYMELFKMFQLEGTQGEIMATGVDAIDHALKKMQHLVADMLDLAKMGTSTGMELQPVELGHTVAQWIKVHELSAIEKTQSLVFSPADDDLMVALDAHSFERVVDNLVSNAIKYTPAGGYIEVTTTRENGAAVLTVADSGYGIPAESLDSIFKAFYRVPLEQHRQAEGTGLGLSIVKAIVEQHNGAIDVVSELGAGSTFVVSLPIL